jgi:2-polyprenyl-6-hydroxyphenyl methylase/3-demethylubiquinone-9 3-methyltransferase
VVFLHTKNNYADTMMMKTMRRMNIHSTTRKKLVQSSSRSFTASTVDAHEVEKFSAMARAQEWWNPNGKLRTLHQINPFRMRYIRNVFVNHFKNEIDINTRIQRGINLDHEITPFKGLKILDVGCGGGLASESLARLGAQVIGLDASHSNIQVANEHKEYSLHGSDVYERLTYKHSTAEQLLFEMKLSNQASNDQLFDAVVSLEVIEHVANVQSFTNSLASFLKPGGALMMTTINRTAKSYLLAIAAAEHLLHLVPPGTHDWHKFITPEELTLLLQSNGLQIREITGVDYNPVTQKFTLTRDPSVNYQLFATKPL